MSRRAVGKRTILLAIALIGVSDIRRRERIVRPTLPPPKLIVASDGELPRLQPAPAPRKEFADKQGEEALRKVFGQNQFAEAEILIEQQLGSKEFSADYRAWLKRQLLVVHTALAWTAIKNSDCASALRRLENLPLKDAPPLAKKALGYCNMQAKNWDAAEDYLNAYTGQQAQDAEGFSMLSEIKEAQGNYEEALEWNEKAKALNETSPRFAKKAQSLEAQQEESLTQTELYSGNFRVRYQSAEHLDLAQAALEVLSDSLQKLNQQLGIAYPSQIIDVTFHLSENFERITHSPAWAAALYDGMIRIPVSRTFSFDKNMVAALRHEVTHAALEQWVNKKSIPSWFHEGLAQVAECSDLCWNYTFSVSTHPFLPRDTFEKSFLGLSAQDAQVAYKQSFYLLVTLYHRHGLPGIRQIMEQLPELDSLESDRILQQIGWNFQGLYDEAQKNWKAQKSF